MKKKKTIMIVIEYQDFQSNAISDVKEELLYDLHKAFNKDKFEDYWVQTIDSQCE